MQPRPCHVVVVLHVHNGLLAPGQMCQQVLREKLKIMGLWRTVGASVQLKFDVGPLCTHTLVDGELRYRLAIIRAVSEQAGCYRQATTEDLEFVHNPASLVIENSPDVARRVQLGLSGARPGNDCMWSID